MECMGVSSGCGCKEVYRFPHITYPYSSCICSFLQQHPYFLFIKKNVFHSCSGSYFLFYVLNNFPAALTHILATTGVKHGSHMKGVGCRS